MGNNKFERRTFLKNALLTTGVFGLSPVEILFSSIIEGIVNEAHAATTNATTVNNYIHFAMRNGPPRWLFDLPLKPNGPSDVMGANPMLITKLTNFDTLEGEYAVHQSGSYHFPHLWSSGVLDANGNRTMLTELLNHSVMIRGVNLGADGHEMNRIKQNAPIVGGYSMDGLAAGNSNKPVPAIFYGKDLNFKSPSGVGIVNTSGSDPITTLLKPFKLSDAKSFGNDDALESMINKAVSALKERGKFADPKVKNLFNDSVNAKKLFEKEFKNLSSVFVDLRAKYRAIIINNLCDHTLEGVDTQAFVSDGTSKFRVTTTSNISAGVDLRDCIVKDGMTQGSSNFARNGHSNTDVLGLADSMAITEYAITNNISTSVLSSIYDLRNLLVPMDTSGLRDKVTINNDSHFVGSHSTMFFFTKFYKAIGGCLLELQRQLIAKNMYDNTIIHMSGDFNRSPLGNGKGSDHGWRGSGASIFSGKVAAPEVLGNILSNYTSKNHPGGWGVAAGMPELNGREMILGNVASSITSILGVPSPTPNDASLLGLNAEGKVVNYAKNPKNI